MGRRKSARGSAPSAAENEDSSSVKHRRSRPPKCLPRPERSSDSARGAVALLQPPASASPLAIRQHWNASATIHRLPPEIFQEILLFAQRDSFVPLWVSWRESKLRALASVSRAWKAAIIHNPSFWPIVDFNYEEKLRKLVLERNPSGPLMIRCHTEEMTAIQGIQAFCESVQLPQRVWSVVLSGQPRFSLPHITHFLSSITELQIQTEPFSPHVGEIGLVGDTPLVHLRLRGATVPWESPQLTSMRSLHLTDLRILPSIAQLQAILSSSPFLEILVFSKLLFFGEFHLSTAQTALCVNSEHEDDLIAPIHLSYLRCLILKGIPSLILDFVLSAVIAPECQFLICSYLGPHHLTSEYRLDQLVKGCARRRRSRGRYWLSCEELEDQEGVAALTLGRILDRSQASEPDESDYRDENREPDVSLGFYFDPAAESDVLLPWLSSIVDNVCMVSFGGAAYEGAAYEEDEDEEEEGFIEPPPLSLHHDGFVQALADTHWPIEHMDFRDSFAPSPILRARDGKSDFPFRQLSSLALSPSALLEENEMEGSFHEMVGDIEYIIRERNRFASRTHDISPIKTLYVPEIYAGDVNVDPQVELENDSDSPWPLY